MTLRALIRKGEYFDSVSLMIVGKQVRELPGVADAAVMMATAENRAILKQADMADLPEVTSASEQDLMIVVRFAPQVQVTPERWTEMEKTILAGLKALRQGDDDSVGGKNGGSAEIMSLDSALTKMKEANLALISVAGKYAAKEAMKAMQRGLHVMLFSDNVSVEEEVELKTYACAHNLLCMGPDCGTAIINGVPLAFANQVTAGSIGIVAASGTGAQEVSSLITLGGGGISQLIGVGGRDVKAEVGGRMLLQGLRLLAQDPATQVIVLVSKPPHPSVLEKIGVEVRTLTKPVVAVFLGASVESVQATGMIAATTLEEGALLALARAYPGRNWGRTDQKSRLSMHLHLQPSQKYIRGLFSGGTFCYEAQLMVRDALRSSEIYSNVQSAGIQELADCARSQGHCLIDFGDDEFTRGRPHPMIDFSVRNRRLIEEAGNPEVAVIMLDLVLGFGANLNPMADLLPALDAAEQAMKRAGHVVPILFTVVGTDQDPQPRREIMETLKARGHIVCVSNSEMVQVALEIGRMA